jgi:hypothetical protein
MMRNRPGPGSQEDSMFFFEKKNQKTFDDLASAFAERLSPDS